MDEDFINEFFLVISDTSLFPDKFVLQVREMPTIHFNWINKDKKFVMSVCGLETADFKMKCCIECLVEDMIRISKNYIHISTKEIKQNPNSKWAKNDT